MGNLCSGGFEAIAKQLIGPQKPTNKKEQQLPPPLSIIRHLFLILKTPIHPYEAHSIFKLPIW
jgi:hypothetical protein